MSPTIAVLIFVAGAALIAFIGTKLTAAADRIADRTGLGEAVVGATLLGGATSLPGITASVVAAADGRPQLAFSNAVGGIAAQTLFLAVADLSYPRANLEHAAASIGNLLQAVLLIGTLSLLVFAAVTPEVSFGGVHPVTPLLFVVYFGGMTAVRVARADPMWQPKATAETVEDTPEETHDDGPSDRRLWLTFAVACATVAAAGYFVTRAVASLADRYDWLGDSAAGAFLTAIATSLPELVTSVAAVRRGALTLAVGGVLGGNCFDTLFAAAADIAYRPGSLYHAAGRASGAGSPELTLVVAAVVMTSLILGGMLVRQERGPGRVGWESVGVVAMYAVTAWVVAGMG